MPRLLYGGILSEPLLISQLAPKRKPYLPGAGVSPFHGPESHNEYLYRPTYKSMPGTDAYGVAPG